MMKTGFTLLELMITLVIVGMIASFAVVSYRTPIMQTQQNSAKLDLINLASEAEQFYDQRHTYEGLTLQNTNYKPLTKDYKFLISATPNSYKLSAIPKEPNQECGTFYLDQAGNKSVSGPREDCW